MLMASVPSKNETKVTLLIIGRPSKLPKTQYQYLAQRSFAKCSLVMRSLDNRSLVRLLRSACPATHPCPRACASCCIYLWPPRHPNTYVSSLFFSPYISIPPAPHSYFFSGLNSKSCQEAQRPACA